MKLPDFISRSFTPFFQSFKSPPPPTGLDILNEPFKSREAFEEWMDNDLKAFEQAAAAGLEHAVESSDALQPTQPIAPSTNAVASSGPSATCHAPPIANTQLYSPSPVAPLPDITDPFLQFNAAQPSASSSNDPTIPFSQANAYQQPYLGTGYASQLGTQWNSTAFDTSMGMFWNASHSTQANTTNTTNIQSSVFDLPASQTGNGAFPTTQSPPPSSSFAGGSGLQSAQIQRYPTAQQQQRQWLMLQQQHQHQLMLQQQQQEYAKFQWQRQQGSAGSVRDMYQGQGQDALGFTGGMNANMGPRPNSYIPDSYPSSSTQMPRPPQRVMGPYPNIVPAPQYNMVPGSVPQISRLARQPSHPQFLQRAQPVATRPATMLGNRTTVDRSAQLAQGSNPGTGETVTTPGTALLQRVFAPPSGGPVAPTGQVQVQPAPELKFVFTEGKKRARKDEDQGEDRPKKKKPVEAKEGPAKAKKGMPRVIALRRNPQVSSKPQGEVGAGPVLQQHAEDKSSAGTPTQYNTITGASQQAEKTNTSTPFIPKPDLEDPAFAELFAKPVTLASLSVVIPPLVACHWGYDGTKPPCGHVCKDRTEFNTHMWSEAHRADFGDFKAQVDCRWPGCKKWERSKGAASLTQRHMHHGFHSWVLTRFLRLKCHQCEQFVGETLEDWSTRSKGNYELKPYADHAEECPKRVGKKEDFLWEVCPVD
ncbi:hypothetical protein FA13DRAFT_1793089 [Coprinellus micaceus]|uniref:Uncharacterized protein n=1 Tax=Coprinellus micaceus TaxID=71717 RepID=A0A4Y7T5E8_COPMI|nr:hypothetical protein FA13DRAFT_1793089 [Coprinellus micaceus]